MAGRRFCAKIELELHAITCPGVWLCPNGKVTLQINTLNSRIESHQVTPIFPLLFHDKFTLKKVFNGVATLAELQRCLEEEFFYAELMQWSSPGNRGLILATFETNLADLLYPTPCFKGLLTGVDVDLLMEPTKYFPGILAPKIEISTRTVIEEVTGVYDTNTTAVRVVNPKLIHSKNPPCFNRKRPAKGIIRQRKVCHSQGKVSTQTCRPKCRRKSSNSQSPSPCRYDSRFKCCRQKPDSTEGTRFCSPCSSNRRSQSQSDRCYHIMKKGPNCMYSSSTPQGTHENPTAYSDSHAFEDCSVCSKYNCYFSCRCQGQDKPEGKCSCKCKRSPSNEPAKYVRYSSSEKGSKCTCRPNSAPSPREDPATSVLKAKIRQLQRAKAKLAHTSNNSNKEEDISECDSCCKRNQSQGSGRQGFYKNLEKFYRRMYTQARMRVQEIDCA